MFDIHKLVQNQILIFTSDLNPNLLSLELKIFKWIYWMKYVLCVILNC